MQIKKLVIICAALTLALSIAGCGNTSTKENMDTRTADKENDILIVYFSAANLNDVDAVS